MAEEQTEERQQSDNESGRDEQKTGGEKAQEVKEQWEEAEEKVKELEEDPPKDLEEWPDDKAKYVTFGGGEGDHGYDEGPEANLGPSSVRRYEDGSVEVDGEMVDNPDDYKMERVEMSVETTHDKKDKDDDEDDSGSDSSSDDDDDKDE